MRDTSTKPCLFLGATGRVGKLVTDQWKAHFSEHTPLMCQTRHHGYAAGDDSVFWDPMDEKTSLKSRLALPDSIAAMLVFLGATPGRSNDMTLNVVLAQKSLEAAWDAGIQRVLIASSSAVYGAGLSRSYSEQDRLAPINAYGHSKIQVEDMCNSWRQMGLEVCALRIGNVAGADALLKSRDPSILRRIDQFENQKGPQRSYIGPRTLAEVLVSLARAPRPLPAVLNIAAPQAVYMSDLATAAGLRWEYTIAKSPSITQYIAINCAELEKLHSFSPDDSEPQTITSQLMDN